MFKQYINGQLVDGKGKQLDVYNPATDEVAGSLMAATAAQATEALEAAQKAFKTWSKTTMNERVKLLRAFRAAIIEDQEHVLDLLMAETGKPYLTALDDFNWGMNNLDFFAEEVKRVYGTSFPQMNEPYGNTYHIVEHRPIGVVVGHLAWNYPMGNAGLKLGPSIASGCTCVLKPSSQTPLATLYFGEVAKKVGIPDGVVNIIAGPASELGPALNGSEIPRMITLIGSSDTGREVIQQSCSTIKTYSLELGGNAPVIIMPDCDLELAAAKTVEMKTSNTGQMCTDYNRIFVHKDVHKKYIELVLGGLKKVKIGQMRDEGRTMGPMINRSSRDHMLDLVKDARDKGGDILFGGNVPADRPKGNFIEPTLIDNVTDDMEVFQGEIFGPIIAVQEFDDLDKALTKAVDTEYGLTSYLFTHDSRVIAECFERFESGEVVVNAAPGGEHLPHVGIKQSGVGCDQSFWSLEEYYNLKRLDLNP